MVRADSMSWVKCCCDVLMIVGWHYISANASASSTVVRLAARVNNVVLVGEKLGKCFEPLNLGDSYGLTFA